MKIIAGRAKSGKSTYMYEEIKREIDKATEDNLIVIVPDLMTYQAEYDIIHRLNIDGIMNVEVLSFKRLASKILEEVGGKDLEEIDIFGKVMVLKEIFDDHSSQLSFFKKTSSQEGFLREFNQLIKEFKQNKVDINSIEEAIMSSEDQFLNSKLEDIKLIYSKYIEKTKESFFDEEDKLEMIVSLVKDSKYIENSKIWIDGFESFDQQRLSFIKSLNERAKDLSLTLNIDPTYLEDLESYDDWEAFKIIHATYESIRETIGSDIDIVSPEYTDGKTNEINMIERNLFSLKPEKFEEATDNIQIYSSMNPYTEVEKTAAKILSLVRDQGYRWKDIKIAVGNMDGYSTHIKKIFNQYEIPYFLDVKRDIMNNPLSKYILSILDIFIWNFKYDNVFEYLKTGLSPLTDNQIMYLENYVIQYGIEGSKYFEEIEKDSLIEGIRRSFISDFIGKVSQFKKLTTVSDITSFIYYFLENHHIYEKLQSDIFSFEAKQQYEEASEYTQAWNYIMDIFKQLLLVGQDRQMSPLEYRKLLEAAFKEVKISIIPPTIDTVEIGDIARIAVSRSKALFMIATNEGNIEFSREKGLLADDEREFLIEKDLKILEGSKYEYFKNKHMLYKTISSPREKLYIGYALGTVEGNSLQPSLYISTIKSIFPCIKEETDISNSDQYQFINNKKATGEKLVEKIREFMAGKSVDPIWADVYSWYVENDEKWLETIEKGFSYNNQVEALDPGLLEQLYEDSISMTVSKLESYGQCSFRYFLENVLGVRPRMTQEIEAYDIGNINHYVLEDFINILIENRDRIDSLTKEDVRSLANECIDRVLEEQSKEISALDANNRNRYIKEKLQRLLNRTAETMVKQLQRSEFRPIFTELKIGDFHQEEDHDKAYIDSVEIDIAGKLVKLRGKIDRIDSYEDENGHIYIAIIDYKSSSRNINLSDALEGIQLQLLVYLNALIQKGEKLFGKKLKIGGVFYYHVDDPIIKENPEDPEAEIFKQLKFKGYVLKDNLLVHKMDKELEGTSDIIPVGLKKDGDFNAYSKVLEEGQFNDLLAYVERKSKELTEGILKGNFQINPYRKAGSITPCNYCDYISICQFDRDTGNSYRFIKDEKDELVMIKIQSKEGSEEDEVDKRARANN